MIFKLQFSVLVLDAFASVSDVNNNDVNNIKIL